MKWLIIQKLIRKLHKGLLVTMHEVGGAVTRQNNNSLKHNITTETGIYHIKNNGTHRH